MKHLLFLLGMASIFASCTPKEEIKEIRPLVKVGYVNVFLDPIEMWAGKDPKAAADLTCRTKISSKSYALEETHYKSSTGNYVYRYNCYE